MIPSPRPSFLRVPGLMRLISQDILKTSTAVCSLERDIDCNIGGMNIVPLMDYQGVFVSISIISSMKIKGYCEQQDSMKNFDEIRRAFATEKADMFSNSWGHEYCGS